MADVVWGGAAVAAVKLWLLHQGCVGVVGVGVVVSAAGKLWLLAQVKLGVVLLAVGCGGCLGGSWGQYSPWPWGQQLGWCASRQCVCPAGLCQVPVGVRPSRVSGGGLGSCLCPALTCPSAALTSGPRWGAVVLVG